MKTITFSLLSLGVLLVSCAEKSKPAAAPERKPLEQRLNEKSGFQQDADGNWKAGNTKRSSFEGKGESAYFKNKDYEKKEYKTGDYAKKSWWGNKEYESKAYTGNTDGSRFQKASDLQGKGAREASSSDVTSKNYATDNYATNAAREAGKSSVKTGSNAITDNRAKLFQQPEIIDWQEERALSLDQSKGILGR